MSEPTKSQRVINIQPLFASEPKVYPRSISGVFQRWRWVFAWLTQIVFYGLCWLPWNGRQAVLFDLDARRFYVFDFVLWPQDTIYLAVLLVISALALFLFTTVAGRVWCGYTCPQTVYTELFLWIEKTIEGDRAKRMKLDAAAWTPRKVGLKTAKHAVWLLVALWTGFTFVGYFTPIRELAAEAMTLSLSGWETFWVLFYGAATYGNAGFMREQMCKYICPYAQFQFVMFDPDTLIVAYDEERGEPRGGRSKKVDAREKGLGDCIDCSMCVQVCPTGIDIRNGLQLECIGCAACIDACDQVMDKMNYPRGLIRYSTENAVKQHSTRATILRRAVRPRVLVYSAVFVALLGGTVWSLATRMPLKLDIQRDRATLASEAADGSIENTFRLQLINASEQPRTYAVTVDGLEGIHLAERMEVQVAPASTAAATAQVRVEAGAAAPGAHPIRFTVTDTANAGVRVSETARFWMP
ncbi:putative iron-sulfur 4Fe-4S ferredoxin transmembrane protein [Azoarcus olearius]|uniref:cytochrome c oxidase accessory protein CcoG n=1 Tax=Azoarcus sp. (strain BH72) TaxID=418699 RepID=UPI0008061DA6|nr:cytochrome c oxidase accessory protein CcoG [Azoarcus olearius]ANQ86259.1 putative iron-sulfur 4Fe-4S ferredoxin transmembrane protein [Azoarcus olearius]